ncbi:hypothetical protein K440DRAFT_420973 [Wilcoxina mikolae CBS 423.85]|nr:hypothetical protein K440DRAFT_420973 [Wilcoxina mikolae CBS 423.85]
MLIANNFRRNHLEAVLYFFVMLSGMMVGYVHHQSVPCPDPRRRLASRAERIVSKPSMPSQRNSGNSGPTTCSRSFWADGGSGRALLSVTQNVWCY